MNHSFVLRRSWLFGLVLFFLLLQSACKKVEPEVTAPIELSNANSANMAADPKLDSIERPTQLGVKLPNPYMLATMQQAYRQVTGSSTGVVATHLYVRFRPASVEQLALLEDQLDLELFDTPLDYQVLQDGDYYQDPAIPDEQITWQYTVVPVGYAFPSGIVYEQLAAIHIPTNLTVEQVAEQLAGLNEEGDGLRAGVSATGLGPGTNTPLCPPNSHWDPDTQRCVTTYCPNGYYWNGEDCITLPPPSPPPAPAKGKLTVTDTQFSSPDNLVGLRKVRVVLKRWFKVERLTTDENGSFRSTKGFRKKVKVSVKFKNEDAIVRGMRGTRLWQMLFPVKFQIGVYAAGDLNTINYSITQNTVVNSKGNRYWIAAITHNAVQQYRDMATQEGIGLPPAKTKILLTNWAKGSGAAPMFAKRATNDLVEAFVKTFIVASLNSVAGGLAALSAVLKREIDIVYNYNVTSLDGISSDHVCETIYHELSHAGHYNKVGNATYEQFVDAVIHEAIANFGKDTSPYGSGNNATYSPIIALGEGYAYHIGYFLANRRYGVRSECQRTQRGGFAWCPDGTNFPQTLVMENFEPRLAADPFHWIPKGLMLDLMDTGVEPTFSKIIDQVSGYTNQQLFNALDADVKSVPDFRGRLLLENNNIQQAQVINLFQQYGY